jgi:hypothetical protein
VPAVDAAFLAWERKELIATDRVCTRTMLGLATLWVITVAIRVRVRFSSDSRFLGDVKSHIMALLGNCIVLAAHTWSMRRRVWYEANREAVVVVVRFLLLAIPMEAYVRSGAWEVSKSNLVVARLVWGLLSTVGWQVNNLLNLVLQLTLFVVLRMGLALKVLTHDTNEEWRCSPLGTCSPSSRLSAARQAELIGPSGDRGFSFSMRGFTFDLFFVVVMPALILLVKMRHSRLMFDLETLRADPAARQGSGTSDIPRATRIPGMDIGRNFATINLLWERIRAWVPLLEFRDGATEARFEKWHRSLMVNADVMKCCLTMVSTVVFHKRLLKEFRYPPDDLLFVTLFYFASNLLQLCVIVSSRSLYVEYRTIIMCVLRVAFFINSSFLMIRIGDCLFEQPEGVVVRLVADVHFSIIGAFQAIGMHLLLRTFIPVLGAWCIVTSMAMPKLRAKPRISTMKGTVHLFQLERLGFTFDGLKDKTVGDVFIILVMGYMVISLITSVLVETYCRRTFMMQESADVQGRGGQSSETRGQVMSEAEHPRRSARRRR